MLTDDEFEKQCQDKCAYCKAGATLRYRNDSNEFVHDYAKGGSFSHSICHAHDFRKAKADG